jgi:hypothetical protein
MAEWEWLAKRITAADPTGDPRPPRRAATDDLSAPPAGPSRAPEVLRGLVDDVEAGP